MEKRETNVSVEGLSLESLLFITGRASFCIPVQDSAYFVLVQSTDSYYISVLFKNHHDFITHSLRIRRQPVSSNPVACPLVTSRIFLQGTFISDYSSIYPSQQKAVTIEYLN